MSRISNRVLKSVIFLHRWMGVLFCLLFLLWFSSAIGMIYWDFPEVSAADRLVHAMPLDGAKIQLSPAQAFARLPVTRVPRRTEITMLDGRPIYRFRVGREMFLVYADNGQVLSDVLPEMSLRIAAAWTGQSPQSVTVEENTEEDQWTVSGEFADLRPMKKYSWPDGEQVYVSSLTGGVVQYTTRSSRIAAYLGPIPHWLYFTPLRKHGGQWSHLVIWASGLATVVAILGLAAGLWMYSPSKRFQYQGSPSGIPYSGQKRWHMLLGLLFGPLACTWAFSGMLSMDPFPLLEPDRSEELSVRISSALRGTPPALTAYDARTPQDVLARSTSGFAVKGLALDSFAGDPVYFVFTAKGQERIVPVQGDPEIQFDSAKIAELIRKAAEPAHVTETRLVTQYESYYLDRQNELPLPAIFAQLDDPTRSMFYVDPKTARIVQSYDAHSRWNRWLYHGLHSINLPFLYRHRPAWDILMLILLLGGISLCVTSLLLAAGVLGRKAKSSP